MQLLTELLIAEQNGGQKYDPRKGCGACAVLADIDDENTKAALERALAGTIGTERLSKILADHGYDVSRRQIKNHRAESETAQ